MSAQHGGKRDASGRRLVFHADDFGMSQAVTDGILAGFREGLLTSTSLLANGPDASRALERWKCLEDERAAGRLPSFGRRAGLGDPTGPFDLGIHLNLTQGRPLTNDYPAALLDHEGRFPGIARLFRRLCAGGERFRPAIAAEVSRQIEYVLDHGLKPTHVNGHHYVEMAPVVAGIVPELMRKFEIGAARSPVEPGWLRFALMGATGCSPANAKCLPAGESRTGRQAARGTQAATAGTAAPQATAAGTAAPQHRAIIRLCLSACVHQVFARRYRRRLDRLSIPHPDRFFGISTAGRIDMRRLRIFLTRGVFRFAEIGIHPAQAAPAGDPKERDGWSDSLAGGRPAELRLLTSSELADYLVAEKVCLARLSELDDLKDDAKCISH